MASTIIDHDTNGQGIDAEVTKTAPRDNIQLISLGMTSLEGENKLNKHLLAYIRLFEPTAEDPFQVCVLLEDAQLELSNQYSTPFENSNPEGRMPNLMGMIQSGQMITSIGDVMNIAGLSSGAIESSDDQNQQQDQGVSGQLFDKLEGLKGRSTFTS